VIIVLSIFSANVNFLSFSRTSSEFEYVTSV